MQCFDQNEIERNAETIVGHGYHTVEIRKRLVVTIRRSSLESVLGRPSLVKVLATLQ
jgi:hypothetical protein